MDDLDRKTCQVFCRMHLSWDLSGVCLMTEVMCFWEGYSGKVPFLSPHIKGTYYQHDLSLPMLSLVAWLEVVLVSFPLQSCSFFLLFHAVLLGRKSLCLAHTKGVEDYAPPPCKWNIQVNYSEVFIMEDLSVRPYLFTRSFIYISMDP